MDGVVAVLLGHFAAWLEAALASERARQRVLTQRTAPPPKKAAQEPEAALAAEKARATSPYFAHWALNNKDTLHI